MGSDFGVLQDFLAAEFCFCDISTWIWTVISIVSAYSNAPEGEVFAKTTRAVAHNFQQAAIKNSCISDLQN